MAHRRLFIRPSERAIGPKLAGRDQVDMPGPQIAASEAVGRLPRVCVVGTRVNASSFAAAQDFLAALVQQRVGAYICAANAYSVTLARDDPHYRQILNGASYVTADGMPIVWALRWLGYAAERVHNDDLFLACCQRFRDWRHFLVGGRAGQPEQAAEEMRRRFKGITVAGTHATPQRPVPLAETEMILAEIRRTQPSVVWVGMGTPTQDYWSSEAAPRAGVPMVAVGSLFDLLSGRTKPTPEWMKRSGLQWLSRLSQEPRRLLVRYVYYNARFVGAISRQLAQRNLHRAGQSSGRRKRNAG